MDYRKILPFIEPIYRFCHHRLSNWHDAEDLAGEILLHVLDGMGKYRIESLEAWVWRIAHNRYARFVDAQNRRKALFSDRELFGITEDYCRIDEQTLEEEYEPVFASLHTLSSRYRDIFVDYYIGELSVRQLAERYALPETTVKWRLNVGRSRIRERIGENSMDKIYQRINWNTSGCNGSMDSDKYLHTQMARAICKAAYEKPLTVEELSLCTGIPALYIEDELSRLEYGDAVRKTGNKYATDFIVFRLRDRAGVETALEPMVREVADYYEELLWNGERDCGERNCGERNCGERDCEKRNCGQRNFGRLGFYGRGFGMERLGYILIPYLIRRKMEDLKNNRLHLSTGDFPPRKDGGHGWFIVTETADDSEDVGAYSTGCHVNAAADENGEYGKSGHLYYYWIHKYYDRALYDNRGIAWLGEQGIPRKCTDGVIPEGMLREEDMVQLLRNGLIRKNGDKYCLNFACFTGKEFTEFCAPYIGDDERIDDLLSRWILSVRKSFEGFVPRRLHGQINQWISIYCGEIIGQVTEELIRRGRLRKPEVEMQGAGRTKTGETKAGEMKTGETKTGETKTGQTECGKPLVDGIFYIEGEFVPV